jgi:hypothetical protein
MSKSLLILPVYREYLSIPSTKVCPKTGFTVNKEFWKAKLITFMCFFFYFFDSIRCLHTSQSIRQADKDSSWWKSKYWPGTTDFYEMDETKQRRQKES